MKMREWRHLSGGERLIDDDNNNNNELCGARGLKERRS
jgi:hypothetical protein